MKQITKTLFGIEVPEGAEQFSYDSFRDHISANEYNDDNSVCDWFSEKLPKGNYRIIGTVTKEIIGFDCRPYVEFGSYRNTFHNYIKNSNHKADQLPTKEDSFRSLLSSLGIYFENSLGDKLFYESKGDYNKDVDETRYKKWKEAENSVVKKLLIIEKVNVPVVR